MLAAAAYYLVPRLTNRAIAAPRLIDWIFWVWVVVGTIQWVLMIIVGIVAGKAFAAGTVGPQLEAIMAPYMMPIGILSIICAIIFLTFVVQLLVSVGRKAS